MHLNFFITTAVVVQQDTDDTTTLQLEFQNTFLCLTIFYNLAKAQFWFIEVLNLNLCIRVDKKSNINACSNLIVPLSRTNGNGLPSLQEKVQSYTYVIIQRENKFKREVNPSETLPRCPISLSKILCKILMRKLICFKAFVILPSTIL